MRNDRTGKEVAWAEILRELRWYIQYQMNRYTDAREIAQESWPGICAMRTALEKVETALRAYKSLREFLGYSRQTAVEKEAEKLLEQNIVP